MHNFRTVGTTIVIFCVLFAVSGLSSAANLQLELTRESTIEKVMQRGVLRVGMDTFLPWAMKMP